MTIDEIRLQAVNAGSQPLNISGNELISILNSIPASGGGSSQWDDVTGGINYADGNVGINKAAPTVALDVVGNVSIANDTATNFEADKGNVYISAIHDDTTLDESQVNCFSGVTETFVNMYASIDEESGGFAELMLNANVASGKSFIRMTTDVIKMSNLQDYATNAAAITGGLVAGDLYYTNIAGEATLKIVI